MNVLPEWEMMNVSRIALCVLINYNMEMFKILGEHKLSIQNSVTSKFAFKGHYRCEFF